jgi:hypothetical protein
MSLLSCMRQSLATNLDLQKCEPPSIGSRVCFARSHCVSSRHSFSHARIQWSSAQHRLAAATTRQQKDPAAAASGRDTERPWTVSLYQLQRLAGWIQHWVQIASPRVPARERGKAKTAARLITSNANKQGSSSAVVARCVETAPKSIAFQAVQLEGVYLVL